MMFYAEKHCSVCGTKLTKIRGKHPSDPPRKVCACCLMERIEIIHNFSDENYGQQLSSEGVEK